MSCPTRAHRGQRRLEERLGASSIYAHGFGVPADVDAFLSDRYDPTLEAGGPAPPRSLAGGAERCEVWAVSPIPLGDPVLEHLNLRTAGAQRAGPAARFLHEAGDARSGVLDRSLGSSTRAVPEPPAGSTSGKAQATSSRQTRSPRFPESIDTAH